MPKDWIFLMLGCFGGRPCFSVLRNGQKSAPNPNKSNILADIFQKCALFLSALRNARCCRRGEERLKSSLVLVSKLI